MKKDRKDSLNPLKLDKATLAQLDDEQLKQIAGGNAANGNPNDPDDDEDSCGSISNTCVSCNKPA